MVCLVCRRGSSGVRQVVGSVLSSSAKTKAVNLFGFLFLNKPFPMHFVYVLYSLKDNKLYKGSTSNIQKRILRHNSGGNKSTAHRKPFVLVHVEQFEDKSAALKKELYLKTLDGGSKLIEFLKSQRILNENGSLNLVQS